MEKKLKVVFVCMGNFCRSPMAEGVLKDLLQREGLSHVEVTSAGTQAFHAGRPPDPRAQQVLKRRGIDISQHRVRRVALEELQQADHILVMDKQDYASVTALLPEARGRVELFLDYAPSMEEREILDPYYGTIKGFEQVLDLIEAAAKGFVERLSR
ncbi:MAG: low molecular weight phosphotyrosine protein phosphatase [Gammaproteobacteria bacterium]|nr:MAG: low molecular weight phosphotyrosine protein phosphatase [Gammaproteobacteria bacterium]